MNVSPAKILRYAGGICGCGQVSAGVMGMIGCSNVMQWYQAFGAPLIRFGNSVVYNNEVFATCMLCLLHIFLGLIVIMNESNLVPVIKGHLGAFASSRVKAFVFLFMGLMMMGIASGFGFAFGIIYGVVAILHLIIGRSSFQWREVQEPSQNSGTTV